jgi:hypothetical protein
MPKVATELTNEQWSLMNALAKASARAARASERTGVSLTQVRELATGDMLGTMICGVHDDGTDIDLSEWSDGVAYAALARETWLRLTDEGHRWVRNNHANRTLRAIADRALTAGRCEIQAVAVPADDEMFAWLAGRRLILMLREDGAEITDRKPPSRQLFGQALIIRLTTVGTNVVQP